MSDVPPVCSDVLSSASSLEPSVDYCVGNQSHLVGRAFVVVTDDEGLAQVAVCRQADRYSEVFVCSSILRGTGVMSAGQKYMQTVCCSKGACRVAALGVIH